VERAEGESPVVAGADPARFHDRLDEIAARLDRLAQRADARGAAAPHQDRRRRSDTGFQIGASGADLDRRPDDLIADQQPPEPREPTRPTSSTAPSFSLDDAIAEISARQQALDDDAGPPAAPSIDLSGVEHLLHGITDQIATLRRPCGVEESVEALRRELADIGRTVAEPKPVPLLDTMQGELRALAERIDRRPPAVEAPTLSAIERGLNEVRDALNARASASRTESFSDDMHIARSRPDAATLDHLDTAIAELRNVSHRVASGDQLAALASDVRTLGAKLDRVAPAAAPDGMDDLLRRMDALAVALESHPRPNEAAEAGPIETQLRRLTDKLDTVEAASDRRGFQHLEAQLAQLTHKLEAADARLGHLGAIEHAVADLVEQLHDARAGALDAAEQAARTAVREMMGTSAGRSSEVDALKHELAAFRAIQADIDRRTQDMLETLQGTLERLVDRLSAIETELPAAAAAPVAAPALPAVIRPAPQSAERRPLDQGLPADHPLEPGTGAPRARVATPAERIAASEAMLPPRAAAEPTGKANFIAAARRAAQAAAADASWEATRSADERPHASVLGTVGGAIAKRRRPLMIGIGVLLLVLGTFQLVTSFLGGPGRQAPSETATPSSAPVTPAPAAPSSVAPTTPSPERRSEKMPGDQAPARTIAEVPSARPEAQSAAAAVSVPGIAPFPSLPGASVAIPSDVTNTATPTIAVAPSSAPPAAAAEKPLPPEMAPGLRSAALAGNPAAEYELALRYAEGRGLPPNLEEAMHWFERAANHGLAPAQYRLGSLYEKGQGVKKDLEAARRLYTAAANKGNGKAMHNLAVLYAEGISGDPDYRNASQWFRKAAEHGVADSQYNLAVLYARGIGVEQNLAESYKWFALAAQQGDKDAGKKRDDVAARLDAQALAAAKQAVQTFAAEPQPAEAIEVKAPPSGWEKPAAAPHAPKVKPAVGSPRRLTPT